MISSSETDDHQTTPSVNARAHIRGGIRSVAWMYVALLLCGALPYLIPARDGDREGDTVDWQGWVTRLRCLGQPPRWPLLSIIADRDDAPREAERPTVGGVGLGGTRGNPETGTVADNLGSSDGSEREGRWSEKERRRRMERWLKLPDSSGGPVANVLDPSGSMTGFYQRLLSQAPRRRPVRISVYSDSINGADRFSAWVRGRLRQVLGDGGKGFMTMTPGWQYQRHQNVRWETSGRWRTSVVNRGGLEDGYYGVGGVRSLGRAPGARVQFSLESPVDRARIFYLRHNTSQGAFSNTARNQTDWVSVSPTVGGALHVETQTTHGPLREMDVRVRKGNVDFLGVSFENRGPGVIVDGLALVGAFTRILRNFDEDHWRAQLDAMGTDLVVFWMGGNDVASESMPFHRESFVRDFSEALRTASGALVSGLPTLSRDGVAKATARSCLVMSVTDAGEVHEGTSTIRSLTRTPRVVAAQKQAALNAGCAFYSTYEFMGGQGSAHRWYHGRPRLLTVDYRHLTRAGSRKIADGFVEAIRRGARIHSGIRAVR